MNSNPNSQQSRPEVQVPAKPTRRRFTAAYKRSVLEQADACSKSGELSALLRREGLYSSHLHCWRRAREQGELAALQPKKRGRKAKKVDSRDRQIADLERQLGKERAARRRAEALVELQKNSRLCSGNS